MLNTGYIAFINQSGGGFTLDGDPIPTTDIISDFVPCSLKTIKQEYKLITDGQIRQASYSAIIDNFLLTNIDTNADKIVLRDSKMADLGTFQVHEAVSFSFTNKLKVVV